MILNESLDFYNRLAYQIISEKAPTLITDGKSIIEINPDRYARAGLKMFKISWAEEVDRLKKLTEVYQTDTGYLLNDFNGCWIYLEEGNLENDFTISGTPSAIPGNFMGLSLESAEMTRSFEVWAILGFSITMGTLKDGFIVLQNKDGFGVSLMKPLTCPHLFFNPSMTFFNGKENLSIIEKIRKANISIAEEITHFNKDGIVDNIIIRDPGGYGFFIFSD